MLKSLLKTVTHSIRTQCGLNPSATKRRRRFQQSLQTDDLEPRLLLTARVWDGGGGANHDWTNRFNWQGNVAPVANDDLVFPADAPVRVANNNFPVTAAGRFRSLSFAGAGYSISGNTIQLQAGITVDPAAGAIHDINNSIQFVGAATRSITVGDQTTLVLHRAVGATAALTKQGTGRLTLAGNNTFSSPFTVLAGVTQLAHSNALGTTGGRTTVFAGAAIELDEFIGFGEEFPRTLTIAEPLTLLSTGINNTGGLRNVGGSNRWTGAISLGAGLENSIGVDASGGEFTPDDLTISGVIGDVASAGLRKRGSGRLTLTGTNTYRGTTLIEEGVVHIMNSSALGSPVGLTRVQTGAGLELSEIPIGGNETVPLQVSEPLQLFGSGFAGNGALRNIAGSNTWLGTVTLMTSSKIGVDQSFDVLAISGLISGAGNGLTKVGVGELLLTANNTFSGRSSFVEAGALTVNGLQPATNILVNGGVLQGTGTVGAVVVEAGGVVSPGGSSIGTLTINGNFVNRGEYRVSVGQTSNDRLRVNGTVNLANGPITVSGNTTLKGLIIIENDLTDAVQGTTNGAQVTSNSGQVFKVNYAGGTGNDVRLDRQNVAPMFTNRLVTPEISEGDDVIVSGTIVEPDLLDTFFMTIDWGDGQVTKREFAPGTPRDINLAHKYVEQDNYTIHLTWTDQSRQGNSGVLQTVVRNVAPVVESGGTASARVNSQFQRRIHFADPGLDGFVATLDYGDGSPLETVALGRAKNVLLKHKFVHSGAFRVTVQVSDNDGGIGTDSFFVIVT